MNFTFWDCIGRLGATSLPVTWANRSVHGLGNCQVKISGGKFCSRIVPTIYTGCYRKTAEKAWNRYQRWALINGTQISARNIPCGKTGLPVQMFLCSQKCCTATTRKAMFHLLLNGIWGFAGNWIKIRPPNQSHNAIRHHTTKRRSVTSGQRELKQRLRRQQRERQKTMGQLFKRSLT